MTGEMTRTVLLANVASTLFLVGLIWFVQGVHYPLFYRVGRERFPAYHAAHTAATTRVVALPMLVEALTSALLVWQPPSPGLALACWIGLGLVMVIWVSTAILQVPRHKTLGAGFDPRTHRSLVRGNWIRTVAWSVRGGLVLFLLSQTFAGGLSDGP